MPKYIYILSSLLFAIAIIHTFFCSKLHKLSKHYSKKSFHYLALHILSEVELVFAFWGSLYLILILLLVGNSELTSYLSSLSYVEPIFVFVIMSLSATKPIIDISRQFLLSLAKKLPFNTNMSLYLTIMFIGPILGSLITEPAAMTISALLLKEQIFRPESSIRFKYLTLALLLINISIGGTLTHYAAPPVVMVAKTWGWDTAFMFRHFGIKALISIILCLSIFLIFYGKELKQIPLNIKLQHLQDRTPYLISLMQIVLVALAVVFSHYPGPLSLIFVIFLIFYIASYKYQHRLNLKPALFVSLFLLGLIILGNSQTWWLNPLLSGMDSQVMFWGATILTAFTDNAALTYLGSLIPTLSDPNKYMLVAGAVCGGGLTLIANAPNPIGYSILSDRFEEGFNALYLTLAALPFTLIVATVFLL